ncbi:proline dehydrogenase [Waterburya agarophytonicola K14]|uniref:Proline dehydrogenase n=1 Tax=Waterburya agarophytonicola KI4 TaxID=2874699 RepID=A0A964BTG8_9CYAN|nr:carbamoyltransferase C-terminal domain-containing protein [Waterburya agarophytonicola]MCC0178536.1 proline dehydrogenase [Waterburya agarophytonicola KI4]
MSQPLCSILALKPGHDGQITAIKNGSLLFSLEAEKDSFPRYESITPTTIVEAATLLNDLPDIVAIGGWVKGWHSVEKASHAGYYGLQKADCTTQKFFGKSIHLYTSTHERSHIYCAYGLSPFPQGQPVYCLVWEGNLGDFYLIDENVNITHLGRVLTDPGNKYAFLFRIADPTFPPIKSHFRFSDPGKLMALAAFSDRSLPTSEEKKVIDYLLARDGILLSTQKEDFQDSPFYNIGVTNNAFKQLAGKYSDAIFERFHLFAREHLTKNYPLIIAGGCGLNCEWNTKWENSGLFKEVFVPPCTNDTGSGIGTAIDAQHHFTGNAKIEWNVYAGQKFIDDDDGKEDDDFKVIPLDYSWIAAFIRDGGIIGWAQGLCEIGPRALGNRSILAAPFTQETQNRLNAIKQRENYRPIAPICLEEDASLYFDCHTPSPYMLFFHRVKTEALKAITHVDGSTRTQTVNEQQNPNLYCLLRAFKELTGYGVMCNTSLNFNGRGFINRTSDLKEYCKTHQLDGFVTKNNCYVKR